MHQQPRIFFRSNTKVRVYNNSLTMIPANALVVNLPSYRPRNPSNVDERKVDVARNTFDDVCDISLSTWSNVNMTFHDNTVKNCDCRGSVECLLVALTATSVFVDNRVCDVSTNVFRNNTDQCLIRLKSTPADIAFDGTFLYNQLLENDVTDGLVIIDSRHFTLSQNLFDNPASAFDVRAVINGKFSARNALTKISLCLCYQRLFIVKHSNVQNTF